VLLSVFAATGSRRVGAVAAVIVTAVAYTAVVGPVLIFLAKRATRPTTPP
jgi:hypothetical protein